MKIRDGFVVRDIGGKTFVVAVGELSKKFSCMITLNETGKLIWQTLENGATNEEVVDKILSVYEDADRETVEKDVALFIERLAKDNILE